MFAPPTGITLGILLLTIALSILSFQNARVMTALMFEPFVIRTRNEWYRFVTHAFIHKDVGHLLMNMFVLTWCGTEVEKRFGHLLDGKGTLAFVALYLGGILFSCVVSYGRHQHDPTYRSLGASGAVSAVLFAFILMSPMTTLSLVFLPIPIPAFVMGILYLATEWYLDRQGGDNIAHDAHLHGAIFGIVFTFLMEPDLVLRFGELQGIR